MIRILGVVFILLGSVNFLMRPSDYSRLALVFLGAFFALAPLVITLLTRQGVLKLYAQKADRDMTVTWEISDSRVSSRTDVVTSDMSWDVFFRVARLSQGFLLYPSESAFLWLPVHSFESAADVERFASLAKSKVKQYDHAV